MDAKDKYVAYAIEHDAQYKARLLATMRENNAIGISNNIYADVVNLAIIGNRATFQAVLSARRD